MHVAEIRRLVRGVEEQGHKTLDELKTSLREALAGLRYSSARFEAEWDAELRFKYGLRLPSQDDSDACVVARDLVEEGRLDEAKALLEQHAPNRLGSRCPTCGVYPSKECQELVRELGFGAQRPALIVPHESRLP